MSELFLNGRVILHAGDSRDVLKTIPDCSIDSIVTDPPYALVSIQKRFGKAGSAPVRVGDVNASNDLKAAYARASAGFMGKNWDTGETAFAVEVWAECLRVLKPGGHVVAFSGTRTYHRMACAIEDAGFEVRDMLSWLYGSGFPKSHDVAKSIDKAERGVPHGGTDPTSPNHGKFKGGCSDDNESGQGFGAGPGQFMRASGVRVDRVLGGDAREWQGWGTALKPACEPIMFARKPLVGTVVANVLQHGTGAINIDGCRVGTDGEAFHTPQSDPTKRAGIVGSDLGISGAGLDKFQAAQRASIERTATLGRWPANIIHDGSEEVLAAFPETQSGTLTPDMNVKASTGWSGGSQADRVKNSFTANEGSAARFFYTAKADADDRLGSKHPTVKPVDLMQWLCRLVTPPGGTVLDPFAGTGTTAEAAFREGFKAVLIEREPEYQADIRRRMALCMAGPEERKRESIKAKLGDVPFEAGSLFA